jgi:hypothetical protein
VEFRHLRSMGSASILKSFVLVEFEQAGNCLDSTRHAADVRRFFMHPNWARRGIGWRLRIFAYASQ